MSSKNIENNWIGGPNVSRPTILDMIKEMLAQPYKLVLVQQHELERLRTSSNRSAHYNYVHGLYEDYIVKGLPKTYLID